VPVRNTRVANLQSMAISDVYTSTVSLFTGLGGDGSSPYTTASVLIFEMIQQRTSSNDGTGSACPESMTMETLPQPKDRRVDLASIPAARTAVILYFSLADDSLLMQKNGALRQVLFAKTRVTESEPVLAF
jgi:hypothetical protein